jgi:outer membrane protein insertion porin family
LAWANRRVQFGWLAAFVVIGCLGVLARAADSVVSPELIGRPVVDVRVVGNSQVSSQVILNLVRTHQGDKFDPATVQEDYQRIYRLGRFSDVQAKVEPMGSGVVVVFQVDEEKLVRSIKFVGNADISNDDLQKELDLKVGEAIEPFRISLAKRAILTLYRSKNFPFVHVDVSMDQVTRSGDVLFKITQGPKVTIRKISFVGGDTFTYGQLNDVVKTTRWYWIFNPGTYDPDQVDNDVASLARFYRDKGYFDVRVGRKLIFSPDQSELQINFLINEGMRYKVDKVSFTGNVNLTETQLRQNLNMVEGKYFDAEVMQRDVKEMVKDYSPLGYIYDPQENDPARNADYLKIGNPNQPYPATVIMHMQPGTVDLVYNISEGKPFRIGRIIPKGNSRSQDKLVLREMHVSPGQLYNSGEIEDAIDRLDGSPYFGGPAGRVTITPIGDQPGVRDLLVEVHEQETAKFDLGGGISSNGGISGEIGFTQRNFDLTNVPASWSDLLSDRAFTGAGQTLRISFQPGTQITSASIQFIEPYLLDQPYSNSDEAYFTKHIQEAWDETRAGGQVTFGKRFNYVWSSSISFKAEDVKVGDIEDQAPSNEYEVVRDPMTGIPIIGPDGKIQMQRVSPRAPEILDLAGHTTVTNIGFVVRRDTTNHGPLAYKGTDTTLEYDYYGALGGQFNYSQFLVTYSAFQTVADDLLDRKTVLDLRLNGGFITPHAPFYNRFYGGGIGSVRGFAYRGISPREGRADDPVGGDMNLLGTLELNYPIYGDNLRGVVFTDIGTVEPDFAIHTIRASVGVGLRLVLPILGPTPIALDIAVPIVKDGQDNVQYFDFAFGTNF